MIDLLPLGDRAWLARFDAEGLALGWAEAVRTAGLAGVVDVVVAYACVAVHLDPDRVDAEGLREELARIPEASASRSPGRVHRIPTLYDGPDLDEVAGRLGLGVADVIAAHESVTYDVLAIGFRPGFPYAGPLPEVLRGLARRDSPRPRVPAGSVAIVGRQTAVYPAESPGGWHLIGRTPLVICEAEAGFFPIRVGDRLRFEPIDADGFRGRVGRRIGEGGRS